MSQAGSIDDGGGSGSDVQQLTPNDLLPVVAQANNINVFGVAANSAQVVDTSNSTGLPTGNFLVENRAFATEYVVDPSAAVGLRGTFQTIQAAITAADTDGRATGRMASILIRAGTYTENLTIAAERQYHIYGLAPGGVDIQSAPVIISGSITIGAGASVKLENILQGGGTVTCAANSNVDLYSAGFNAVTTSGDMTIFNCDFSDLSVIDTAAVEASVSQINTLTMSGALSRFNGYNCEIVQADISDNSALILSQCFAIQSITGTSTLPVRLVNCQFLSTTPINPTATVVFAGVSEDFNGNVATSFFGANPTLSMQCSLQGNTLNVRRVAGNIVGTIADYVLAVTDTSIARTVTLPSVGVLTNQSFIIKDESLNAGTNAITVSSAGKTIDGQPSQVLNADGGAFTAYYDGANYFIL